MAILPRLKKYAKRGVGAVVGVGTVYVVGGFVAMQKAYAVPEEHKKAVIPEAKTAVVIGGGVIGFSTARELARSGLQVRVLEQHPGPAMGCSSAPAGHISVSAYHSSFASVSFALGLLPALINDPDMDNVSSWSADLVRNKFVKFSTWLDPYFWAWNLNWVNLTAHNYVDMPILNAAKERRAMRSTHALAAVAEEEGIMEGSDMRMCGRLNLAFHTVQKSAFGMRGDKKLTRYNAREVGEHEPLMAQNIDEGVIRGGLMAKNDYVGECKSYTTLLSEKIQEKYGVEIMYNSAVRGLETKDDKMVGVRLKNGELVEADLYVLCAGPDSPQLAVSAGVHVPITSMRGYKVIAKAKEGGLAQSAVCCKPYELYVTPLLGEMHFASFGEFAPHWDHAPTKSLETRLEMLVEFIFPNIRDMVDWDNRRHAWGRRPQTPDGSPVVSPTKVEGLYMNCGHCSYGFRSAALSAQLLANGLRNGFEDNGVYYNLTTLERFQPIRGMKGNKDADDMPALEDLGADYRFLSKLQGGGARRATMTYGLGTAS